MFGFVSNLCSRGGSSKWPSYLSDADRHHFLTYRPARNPFWNFTPLAAYERTETWPEELNNLVKGIEDLVNSCFANNLNIDEGLPWTTDFDAVFYELAQSVAQPDPTGQGWNELLTNGVQRSYLIRGVIMKALESTVFCEPLFGVTDGEYQKLRSKYARSSDGFKDAKFRAVACREYAKADGVISREYAKADGVSSEAFWDKVDQIAVDFLCLLLPLYNMVERHRPDGTRIMGRNLLHRDLHDIIAASAWLSISMRLDPSVMQFQWPELNELCHWTHVDASPSMYQASEESREEEFGLDSITNGATARVKMVITPEISRHEEEMVLHHAGSSKTVLLSPLVVYYAGDPPVEKFQLRENIPRCLVEHVQYSGRKQRRFDTKSERKHRRNEKFEQRMYKGRSG